MPLNTLKLLKSGFPLALLSNLYGPTEITVDAIYWIFDNEIDSLDKVPLGKPCTNHRILFLDDRETAVTRKDKIAEICIAGPGVALGYWNDPQTTLSAFIPNPDPENSNEIIYKTGDLGYLSSQDGLIYMTGRKDNQFKHFGYRIEAGEIENALIQLDYIFQSCIVYDPEKKRIQAFYISKSFESTPPFRKLLSNILPKYMIPHSFHRLERFPVTPNGKIDRNALMSTIELSKSKN